MLDNRQIIPGWGGPMSPWGGWGGWPWYGGMSTVMFAALIYSLSVLPAMMQLFSKFKLKKYNYIFSVHNPLIIAREECSVIVCNTLF